MTEWWCPLREIIPGKGKMILLVEEKLYTPVQLLFSVPECIGVTQFPIMTSPRSSSRRFLLNALAAASITAAATSSANEHLALLLAGEKDAFGNSYSSNVYPLGLSDAGVTTSYVQKFFGGTDFLYRISASGVDSTIRLQTPVPGGGTFRSISQVDTNAAGQMALRASTTNGPQEQLFLVTGSQIREMAAVGKAAAGDGTFKEYGFGDPALSQAGHVAFFAETTASGQGIFLASPSGVGATLQKIAKVGDDSGDGGTFLSFGKRVAVASPTGLPPRVAFYANTSGTISKGFFVRTVGVTTAPLWSATIDADFAMNNHGEVVQAAGDILLGYSSGMQVVISRNTVVSGGAITNLSSPVINDRGDIVCKAQLNHSGSYRDSVLLRTAAGVLRIVAQQGGVVEGGTFDSGFSAPQVNNNGMVMFTARYQRSATTYAGIFLGDGLDLVKIIATGDPLLGSVVKFTPVFLSSVGPEPAGAGFLPGHASFNESGQVAYRTSLINEKLGIFLSSPTILWRNTGSTAWSTAANWMFDQVPGSGSIVAVSPAAATSVVTPAGVTLLRKLTLGNGTDSARLQLSPGSILKTELGIATLANSTLSGDGHVQGGLSIAGAHERSIDSPQNLAGAVTYASSSRLRLLLTDDSPAQAVTTGALSIASGAGVELSLDAPGSTVDFSQPFWKDIHIWRLFNAASLSGAFALSSVSPDSQGMSLNDSIGSFSLRHIGKTVDLVWTPFQFQPSITEVADQLAPAGQTVTLSSSGVGNALAWQWKRNGSAIATGKSATFSLPNAALANAGNYTATASNAAGSASTQTAARLGIVNIAIPAVQQMIVGGTLNLSVAAAAPAGTTLNFIWRRGTEELSDGTSTSGSIISGSGSAKLKISRITAAESGDYTCLVSMGSLSLPTRICEVQVVSRSSVDKLPVPEARVSAPFQWQLSGTEHPTSFSISGLPTGLTYNRVTGLITGSPEKSGSFKIKVATKNAAGTSLVEEFTLDIDALPTGSSGAYSALVDRESNVNAGLGGLLTLQVQPSGFCTGSLKNGSTSYNLKGRLLSQVGDEEPTLLLNISQGKNISALSLTLTFITSTGQITGTLSDSSGTASVSGDRHDWAGPTAAASFAHRYNALIQLPAADPAQPTGTGWQQITVKPTGSASAAGRTPDGISYTCAGILWADGSFPQFAPLYKGIGSITGLPQITLGTAPADHRVSGWVEQVKNGPASTADQTYRTGIPLLRREVTGSVYIPPSKTSPIVLGLPETDPNASLSLTGGGLETAAQFSSLGQDFRISKTNAASFATGGTTSLKLSFTAASGLFTGTFTLTDSVAAKPLVRKVTINGLLISHLKLGQGYLLLPELPAAKTSPVFSGLVEIKAAD